MTWTIQWSGKAFKQLEKLKQDGQTIYDAVGKLEDDPYSPTKQLIGSKLRSFRVGNYRVILNLIRQQLIIYVVKVAKRGRAYDRL